MKQFIYKMEDNIITNWSLDIITNWSLDYQLYLRLEESSNSKKVDPRSTKNIYISYVE